MIPHIVFALKIRVVSGFSYKWRAVLFCYTGTAADSVYTFVPNGCTIGSHLSLHQGTL